MILIGFSFSKILVERKKDFYGQIEVKSNINLLNIEKLPSQTVDKQDILKVNFETKYTYAEAALLQFEGDLLIALLEKESEQLLKEWKKDKKINTESKLSMYNMIFYRCNLKALQLEQDVNLPVHLQMPVLKSEEEKKK